MKTPIAPLFIPGHMRRMREKAITLGLDAILIDLEDAVPGSEKTAAREGALELIGQLPKVCFVRINPLVVSKSFGTGCGAEDLAAVVGPALSGIVAPKIESAAALRDVESALSKAERAAALRPDSIELSATIETALGVVNLVEISRVGFKRPMRLSFGMGDFTTDIGVEWSRGETESALPRAMVPIVSRAAGLRRPRDSVFVNVADMEGLRESAIRGKRLGYGGKSAIHPSPIEVIRDVYRPTKRRSHGRSGWSKRRQRRPPPVKVPSFSMAE
ncbi:MAG: CoA ester lyase [Variovorax sp.]